jgi:hypothetical protein
MKKKPENNSQDSSNKPQDSRRSFIRNAALAAAGFYIVPRHVLGRGFVAPSDKLQIAGVGAGGKGESDLLHFSKAVKPILLFYAM